MNHVVNVVNVTIEWFTKAGVQQYQQSLQTFFAPLAPTTFTFDPKVIYDQYNNRFIVITLEKTTTPDTSRILVAVSDDGDPNGTWYFQMINSIVNITPLNYWADYPGLAIDSNAIYITANLFDFLTSTIYGGARLWIIDNGLGTGGLYDGSTSAVTVHDPFGITGTSIYAGTL
jgi:hypothetical protein